MKVTRQLGFSLVEVFISLSFIGVLLLAVNAALTPWLTEAGEQRNIKVMKTLQNSMEGAYLRNSWRTEDNNRATPRTSILMTQAGVRVPTNPPVVDAVTGNRVCRENQLTSTGLAPLLRIPAQEVGVDGFQNPICIFIGQPMDGQYLGVRFTYSNIYMISPGKNRALEAVVDPSRNLVATSPGRQVDDYIAVVNGYEVQKKAIEQALSKLEFVGEAYNSHFTSQFLAEISREYTINYFCRPVSSGYCTGADGPANILRTLFQRDATNTGNVADFRSPFQGAPAGQDEMRLLNDPPTKTQPPFISTIYFPMPGGMRVEKILAGSY